MKPLVSFRNVTYTYPEGKGPVLRDFNLEVEEGEFLLVIGASGAGKSTFLRCLNGLVPHFYGGVFRGEVRVAGRDPVALGPRGMSDLVGFVFQDPEAQFVVDVVEDELAFAMENQGLPQVIMRRRIEEVLDQMGLAPLRYRRVNTLSGGEKQRVAIGAVLTLQPRLLVLDEPTSQLDPQAAEEVLTALQKLNQDLGLTVILSEHRLERVVQYADRILYLPGGGFPPLSGKPAEVLAQVELTPPLITLGKKLGWEPLPLTIKAGQNFASQLKIAPFKPEKPASSNGRDLPSLARAIEVWFSYGEQEALRGTSFSLQEGEVVALMGRNGSGKTTLLKHLVGLLYPQQGRVELWGQNTRRMALEEIIRRVGYVPQNPNALLFAETVQDELNFTRRNHGLPPEERSEILKILGLEGHANSYPRDLSVGERQRVALAAILAAEPELILLDEPTRGLDYREKSALADFLKAQREAGKTVFMATHDVELVARCADRVIILGEGQVVAEGPTREVMAGSMVFSPQVSKLFREANLLTVEEVLSRVVTI